jgi:predicted dehydrogenase
MLSSPDPFQVKGEQSSFFLAEALWTRYFPIFQHIRNLLHTQRVLGKIHRVISDVSLNFPDPIHSIRNPSLGGGALLAIGLYPLTWAMMAIHESVAPSHREKPVVQSSIVMAESHQLESGSFSSPADEQTNVLLTWKSLRSTAIVSGSLNMKMPKGNAVLIQGEKVSLIFRTGHHPLLINFIRVI